MQIKSHLGLAALILLNLAITIPLALQLNIWIDEAYSLNTTAGGLLETIRTAIAFENQPPLYFILLDLWRSLNDSIFFARLFSCFCLSLTLFFAAKVSQRYLKGIHPTWFVAAIAFHPYAIAAALEIRTYGFAILLSVLLLLLFFDGYLAERPQKKARIGYGMLAIAALYTHYFLGCLIFAHWVTLLLLRRWRDSLFHSLILGGVSLAFSPLLLSLSQHLISQGEAMTAQTDTLIEGIRSMVGRLALYLLPSDFQGLAGQFFGGYRYLFLLLFACLLITYHRRIQVSFLSLLITLTVATGTTIFLLDWTDNVKLTSRYSYPLFVPTLLVAFAIFACIPAVLRQRGLKFWGMILALLYCSSLVVAYHPLAKDGDWQRVAAYITAQEEPNQPVLVFSAEGLLPLRYYYHGINNLRGLPAQTPGGQYNLRHFILNNDQEIQAAIANPPQSDLPEPDRLWLVKAPGYVLDGTGAEVCHLWGLDLGCQRLEQFVTSHYEVQDSRNFYGAQVQQLAKREPT